MYDSDRISSKSNHKVWIIIAAYSLLGRHVTRLLLLPLQSWPTLVKVGNCPLRTHFYPFHHPSQLLNAPQRHIFCQTYTDLLSLLWAQPLFTFKQIIQLSSQQVTNWRLLNMMLIDVFGFIFMFAVVTGLSFLLRRNLRFLVSFGGLTFWNPGESEESIFFKQCGDVFLSFGAWIFKMRGYRLLYRLFDFRLWLRMIRESFLLKWQIVILL